MRFTLNPKAFTNRVVSSIANNQDEATRGLMESAKALTPENTGLMLDSYRLKKTKIEGFITTSGVTNSAVSEHGFPYPVVIESGVGGKIYKYQKPKGNKLRHVGVGVQTFSRAVAAYKDIFLSILKQ